MSSYFSFSDSDLFFQYTIDENPKNHFFQMHTHEYAEILILLSGKGVFKVEGNEYILSSGDIVVLKPYESHVIELDESCPYERIALHFNLKILESVEISKELLCAIVDRQNGHDNLIDAQNFDSDIHREIIKKLTTENTYTRTEIIVYLIMLLYEISQCKIPVLDKSAKLSGDTISHEIANYVMEHIDQPITLTQLCNEFYISKTKLCTMFYAATGSTVKNYITTKKISYAKWLIEEGREHPTVAAAMCGFSDYSNFYRAYKKYYNFSPSETYKRKHNQTIE